jgi:hypothetical protein
MKRQMVEDLKVAEDLWRNHEMGGHDNCRNCRERDDDAALEIRIAIGQLESGKWNRDTVEIAINYTDWIREERQVLQ